MKQSFQVKEVARLSGVSIRTLHYYDEIALLTPSGRTAAGYRLYTEDDLLRMQQILIGRSLGFPLEEIRRWLDDPGFDYESSLREQRGLLVERVSETNDMIAAIDRTLAAIAQRPTKIDFETLLAGFDPEQYRAETEERWGETDWFRQGEIRTRHYGEEDWRSLKAEADRIFADAAEALVAGKPPDSAIALDLVERHRRHICRWFYDLSPQMHVKLAGMWENDRRFAKNIDRFATGLTAWFSRSVGAAAELKLPASRNRT